MLTIEIRCIPLFIDVLFISIIFITIIWGGIYLREGSVNNDQLKEKFNDLVNKNIAYLVHFSKKTTDEIEKEETTDEDRREKKILVMNIKKNNFEEQYIQDRAIDQICYYDKYATLNKRRYKYCQTVIFILSGFITLSPIIEETLTMKLLSISSTWISAICGAGILFITNFVGMNKFHHLMTEHRIVCENIKSLTMEYLCSKYPNEKFKNYVNDIENTINNETNKWAKTTSTSGNLEQKQ